MVMVGVAQVALEQEQAVLCAALALSRGTLFRVVRAKAQNIDTCVAHTASQQRGARVECFLASRRRSA